MTGRSGPTNVLIIATMHNSLYAFPADRCGPYIWRVNFGANQAPNSYPGTMGSLIYNQENGCKGTPVVDRANGWIFSVCSSPTDWIIRKTNLLDGSTLATTTVNPTVSGVSFCPLCQQNTAGLTLANGKAYVSFGSMVDDTDHGPWHGWVVSYDESTLTQQAAFCTTCASGLAGGGIWQSGGGLSVDGSGNLYAITGNGSGTPSIGNLCLSVVKLSPSLSVSDWYAPSNFAALNAGDEDLASGRPMLIPDAPLVVFGAKDFNVYSVNTNCMGNIGGTNNGCTSPQVFATGSGPNMAHNGVYAGLYIPGLHKGYFGNTAGNIYAFSLAGSTWNMTPAISAATYEFPGAQMAASCNAGSNCVIFATMPTVSSALFAQQPGRLIAINPSDLSQYWSSTGRPSDAMGTLPKFTVPTIANGKIYVGTLDSTVVVYGPNSLNPLLISN
jgi:hypothetical protein